METIEVRREVRRGDALVARGAYPVSYRLDVALEELAPIADGSRVETHLGTFYSAARVVRVGAGGKSTGWLSICTA